MLGQEYRIDGLMDDEGEVVCRLDSQGRLCMVTQCPNPVRSYNGGEYELWHDGQFVHREDGPALIFGGSPEAHYYYRQGLQIEIQAGPATQPDCPKVEISADLAGKLEALTQCSVEVTQTDSELGVLIGGLRDAIERVARLGAGELRVVCGPNPETGGCVVVLSSDFWVCVLSQTEWDAGAVASSLVRVLCVSGFGVMATSGSIMGDEPEGEMRVLVSWG